MKNSCNFIGRLTRDIELRNTSGGSVANFGLALNKRWTSKDGEKKELVTYVDFEAWGRDADNLAKLASKGTLVNVESEYNLQKWEKDGETRYSPKFRVNSFIILSDFKNKQDLDENVGEAEDEFDDKPSPRAKTKEEVKPKKGRVVKNEEDEEDVPF